MKYKNTVLVLWLAMLITMLPIFFSHLLPDWVLRVYASIWIGTAVSNDWVRRRAAEREAVRFANTKIHLDGLFKRDVQ